MAGRPRGARTRAKRENHDSLFLRPRRVTDARATREVAAHLAVARSPVYASDVAIELRLHPLQVERIFRKFHRRGWISPAW